LKGHINMVTAHNDALHFCIQAMRFPKCFSNKLEIFSNAFGFINKVNKGFQQKVLFETFRFTSNQKEVDKVCGLCLHSFLSRTFNCSLQF